MKILGLKYKLLLLLITIIFITVDIVLMLICGFDGQFLILLYVLIGLIPTWCVISLFSNMSIPTITMDNNTNRIITDWIANERYKSDRGFINQGDELYYDEIISCDIDKNKLIVKLSYGQTKTFYLGAFTPKQILQIKNEIDMILKYKD